MTEAIVPQPFPLWKRWALRAWVRRDWVRLSLLAVTLAGFLLRLPLLTAFPFREDEAIYSVWALHLWQVDPLALHVWPDKPPLFLWILGGAFALLGPSEASARLVNVLASSLSIPLAAAIAQRWGGRTAALLTALFFALNPFAISFAATAYTDPMLVLFGLLAVDAAGRRRTFWAGLWLGAAIMTKQQGLLFVPLVIGGWRLAVGNYRNSHFILHTSHFTLLLGLALITLPILYWDSLRWSVAPSPWDLSVRNYGGFALAPIHTWPTRAAEWLSLLWYFTASWPLWIGLMAGGGWRVAIRKSQFTIHNSQFLWPFAFLAFHIVTTTQVWDRYLLPLVPVFCISAGILVAAALPRMAVWARPLISAVLALLLVGPAITAAQGGYPIGGDHGDYAGLTEATDWVRDQAPADSVLYHHSLGWHHRFSFFDATASGENRFDLRWYPHAVYLADNAAKIAHRPRFAIMPEWDMLRDWERAFAGRRLQLVERFRAGKVTVYEILGPPQDFCAWCACQPRTTPFTSFFNTHP